MRRVGQPHQQPILPTKHGLAPATSGVPLQPTGFGIQHFEQAFPSSSVLSHLSHSPVCW